jgi:hypothetical protein
MVDDVHPDLGAVDILFAGGCHTIGYPIGEAHSFPRIVQQELAQERISVAVGVLPYLKMSHQSKLIAKCQELQPGILVLQLGHFELDCGLKEYFRRRVGAAKRGSSSKPSLTSPRQKGFISNPSRFYLKSHGKALLDRCLGHPLVNLAEIEALGRNLLSALHNAVHIPLIVLLSPLPCADHTTMYYRTQTVPVFRGLASQYRCEFIDVLAGAPIQRQTRFGPDAYYYDAVHLSDGGHQAVAKSIVARLRPAVRSLGKCLA